MPALADHLQTHPDRDEFADLLEGLQSPLRYYALSLTGSKHDAEEVLQNTNALLWKKRDDFELGTNFKAWAFRVAFLESKTWHRKQARIRRSEVPSEDLLAKVAAAASERDRFDRPREVALATCLKKLREDFRTLIIERYVVGRDVTEMARDLDMTANALSQKLFRIRGSLVKCVAKQLSLS